MQFIMPYTHQKRRICAAQIAMLSVCIEQYMCKHVINQRIMFPERHVESLALCMPNMDKE